MKEQKKKRERWANVERVISTGGNSRGSGTYQKLEGRMSGWWRTCLMNGKFMLLCSTGEGSERWCISPSVEVLKQDQAPSLVTYSDPKLYSWYKSHTIRFSSIFQVERHPFFGIWLSQDHFQNIWVTSTRLVCWMVVYCILWCYAFVKKICFKCLRTASQWLMFVL